MLATQATETQPKQNIFRSCPVFSAVSLQWWWQTQSLYRNSIRLLQKSSQWGRIILPLPLMGQRYPILCLSGWSLLLWWYTSGVPGLRCLGSAVYPHQNSISQDGTVFTWTEQAVLQRNYTLFLALIWTQFSEKELEFSVFSYTLC